MTYILQGLHDGFSIGFHEAQVALQPLKCNIPSAYKQPHRYLQAQCKMVMPQVTVWSDASGARALVPALCRHGFMVAG